MYPINKTFRYIGLTNISRIYETFFRDSQNPFGGEDDWVDNTEYESEFADLGEPVEGGTCRVCALYSYQATEDDEISFNVGEYFIWLYLLYFIIIFWFTIHIIIIEWCVKDSYMISCKI